MARTVDSKKELMQAKDDLMEEGWSTKTETNQKVVMKQNDYGGFGAHVLILLLTGWFLLGLGNLAYAAKRYWMNSRKRVIRVTE